MNSDTKKKIIKLIFPSLILIVMVVLIIMAKHRDNSKILAAKNSSTVTESSEESSEEIVDENKMAETGPAVTIDQLGDYAAVEVRDGIIVSFIEVIEEGPKVVIRIDNNTSGMIGTNGLPTITYDGEAIPVISLGANTEIALANVPAGEYRLLTYKVNAKAKTCTTMTLAATLCEVAADNTREVTFDYTLDAMK